MLTSRLRGLLCVVLVVITLPSYFVVLAYGDGTNYELCLASGIVGLRWGGPEWPFGYAEGFEYWSPGGGLEGLLLAGSSGTMRWVCVPFWPITYALVIWTVVAWWRGRDRWQPGSCPQCGYNLTGNVSGRCPGCGTEVGEARAP